MCAARRAVCAARTPRPAPRAPARLWLRPCPAAPLGRAAGKRRHCLLYRGPGATRAPHQPCAPPASPPRPDPRRAPLPASAPSSRLLLQKKSPFWFTAFAPPRSALPGQAAARVRPQVTGGWPRASRCASWLRSPGQAEWPESVVASSSLEDTREISGTPGGGGVSSYSGDQALPLILISERLECCSRPYTPGLKCSRGSG